MSINAISPVQSHLINILSNDQQSSALGAAMGTPAVNFSDILTDAFATAAQADTDDKTSALELISGQSDDLAALMIDATKAELSLNLAIQIRNKVVDAYNEIMRMQV